MDAAVMVNRATGAVAVVVSLSLLLSGDQYPRK
jgi:hypothetical protein